MDSNKAYNIFGQLSKSFIPFRMLKIHTSGSKRQRLMTRKEIIGEVYVEWKLRKVLKLGGRSLRNDRCSHKPQATMNSMLPIWHMKSWVQPPRNSFQQYKKSTYLLSFASFLFIFLKIIALSISTKSFFRSKSFISKSLTASVAWKLK